MVNIYLRPLSESDARKSYLWRNIDEIWMFTGSKPSKPISVNDEIEWIRTVLSRKNERRFAICLSNNDEYVGNVQLTDITNKDAEIHLFIGEMKYWNKGIGSKAIKLILDVAFKSLSLELVYLKVKKENLAALKLYRKHGFVESEYQQGSTLKLSKINDKKNKK